MESTAQTCKGYSILYFTPKQHALFTGRRKRMIRGPAGSDKTVLILLKIVELANRDRTASFKFKYLIFGGFLNYFPTFSPGFGLCPGTH